MLSILIPTYNFDSYPLARELHQQAVNAKISFEILVYDDASTEPIETNKSINDLEFATFKVLKENIGRSAIRNLLGRDAKYPNLLFVDAGTFPSKPRFIKNYLLNMEQKIVSGGMIASLKKPETPFKLRWLYTKKRESKKLCSSNFRIYKNIFLENPFNESVATYGYEDVLFFKNLKDRKQIVKLIDNPVIHASDDSTDTFIKKTELALHNLKRLSSQGLLRRTDSQVFNYYKFFKTFGLCWLIAFKFRLFKKFLLRNLHSNRPNLLVYDIYRIGYFCTLK